MMRVALIVVSGRRPEIDWASSTAVPKCSVTSRYLGGYPLTLNVREGNLGGGRFCGVAASRTRLPELGRRGPRDASPAKLPGPGRAGDASRVSGLARRRSPPM